MGTSIDRTVNVEPAGNPGEIQWNDSGEFGASSNLYWDNANGRLSVGQGNTPTANLDVRAGGALSSDIAFRVRNSADTQNILDISGNHVLKLRAESVVGDTLYVDGSNNSVSLLKLDATQHRGIRFSKTGSINTMEYITQNSSSSGHMLFKATAPPGGFGTSSLGFVFQPNASSHFFTVSSNNRIGIGDLLPVDLNGGSGTNVIVIKNGTAPTNSIAGVSQFYSSDIVAGNAAPHFRTENGDVVKLYKQVDSALANTPNSGDANTDALITALKNIIINAGFGADA